jgi:hypothetical protein
MCIAFKPILRLFLFVFGISLPFLTWAQGALNPPGPPGPLFKTLSQVEPRYPISDYATNLTLPGSYYLTTNLVASPGTTLDAITIKTNMHNITIDLNGFVIMNTNAAGPSSSAVGIRISGATNIVIHNGQFFGFDRGIRVEAPFYGILVENVHAQNCSRSGIEGDGTAGNPISTMTVRNCVVENINGTGEGANVSCDGIVVLNCTGVVDGCVVRDITAVGVGTATCINVLSATNSFINNNFLSNAQVGLSVSGGGTRAYYRDNLTSGCATPFSNNGGVDRGGNF